MHLFARNCEAQWYAQYVVLETSYNLFIYRGMPTPRALAYSYIMPSGLALQHSDRELQIGYASRPH